MIGQAISFIMKIDKFSFRVISLLTVLLLVAVSLPAQQHRLVFEEIGVKEGLPEEFARDIIQDDQGYIWIATQNGLVKYDGIDLKVFRKFPGEKDKHLGNIPSLLKGRDGKIWISSWDSKPGIKCYDPKLDRFFFYQDTIGRQADMYQLMKEDLAGNIWLQIIDFVGGKPQLVQFDPGSKAFTRFSYGFPGKYNGLFSTSGKLADSKLDSSLWLLDGCCTLLKKELGQDTFSIVLKSGDLLLNQPINRLLTLAELGEGNLALSTPEQLIIWDISVQAVQKGFTSTSDGNKSSLAVGTLAGLGVFQLPDERLWVSHLGGNVSIVDLETDSVSQFLWQDLRREYDWLPERISDIQPAAKDESGLWLEVRDGYTPQIFFGRFDFASQAFTFFNGQWNDPLNPTVPQIAPNRLLVDHSGLLWAPSRPGLYKQSPESRQFDYFLKNEAYGINLPSDSIRGLYADRRNWIWMSTVKGLGRYKPEKNEFKVFKHNPDDPNSIPGDWAWFYMEDRAGNLWISFGNGFAKWLPETDQFQRFMYDPIGGEDGNNGIGRLIELEDNEFLIQAYAKGIFSFDTKSGQVKPEYLLKDGSIHGLNASQIRRLHVDSYGDWWVGNILPNEPPLFRKKKGSQKFITYLSEPEDTNSISSNRVVYFYEDTNKNLWIGTADKGFNLYNREEDHFTRFWSEDIPSMTQFVTTKGKKAYFTTYSGSGLIQVDPEQKTYRTFSEEEGLLHNDLRSASAQALISDFSGNIWLPTQRGLSIFNPETETFSNYTRRDGFFVEDPTQTVIDQNGTIWIGGYDGLHRIDPVELEKKDSTLPKIVLTGLRINDQHYDAPDSVLLDQHISHTKEITLNHRRKNLTFEFIALHYLRPEDNQYSWKLENYDEDWSKPSLERKAIYTNLNPGTYTFRIKGSNADGIWNEEGTSLMITILPPWWATTWAYLGYLILLGGLVWGVVQWRTRYLRKQRQQLQTKVSEQTQELRERNAELRIAKEEALAAEAAAREANETKSNFLSTVSHELRTPLTSVLGFAKIIRKRFTERVKPVLPVEDSKLNRTVDQIEKNLDVVVLEGERLTNLINDVLDLAKIESGRTEWHLEPIDLNVLVHQAYRSTSALFEGKNLVYEENLAPSLPTVTGDHDKLVQVMINLLSNAVKFTDEGTISVSTRLEQDQVIIAVKDTGIGIAREDMPKVFEKFRQVGDTLTDKPKGTGLGLPICQEIIEYLGGEIWVDSAPGVGSTFAFSLPLKEKDRPGRGPSRMEELIEELKKKMSLSSVVMPQKQHSNILVVDDEPSIRELLRQELSDTGYQVTLAENGKQALQKVREQRPDMIILDVMMPELNGFDLAAILKNDPKTLNIPILILSIVEDQERGYQIGVDRYLNKPIDTDLLLSEVETLLNNGTSSKKVLVIDENQSTMATMASVLSAKGFEVVEAGSANLLERARESMPDVIILNSALHEREQIMRALRFEKGLESVLIIMYQ